MVTSLDRIEEIMIDKIRQLLSSGVKMRYASKSGVRTITIEGGSVQDPNAEINSYVLDKSYDGKIVIRFYLDGEAQGYLFYRQEGVWRGNNRSVWVEMTPDDPTVWHKEYVPPVKSTVVAPIKEPLVNPKEFNSYESVYEFEATTDEAVVVLVPDLNSKLLANLAALGDDRDIIVEVDGELPTDVNALVAKIKQSLPNAHLIHHKVRFGLGRLVVNAHNNVFKKYRKAFFMVDGINLTERAVDLAFRFSDNSTAFAHTIFNPTVVEGEPYDYTVGALQNAYVMTAEAWDGVKEHLTKYKELFLVTKYESRPHHSITKWLKESGVSSQDSDVFSVMAAFADKPTLALVCPRATKVGSPISYASDSRRKTFKEQQ